MSLFSRIHSEVSTPAFYQNSRLLPFTPAVGSVLVMMYGNEEGKPLTGVSDDVNGAWTEIFTASGWGTGAFWKRVTTSAATTVSWTNSAALSSGGTHALSVSEYTPPSGTIGIDVVVVAASSLTTDYPDDLFCAMLYGYPTPSVASDYSDLGFAPGFGGNFRFQDKTSSTSTGTNSCAFGSGGADLAFAFQAVVGGGTTPAITTMTPADGVINSVQPIAIAGSNLSTITSVNISGSGVTYSGLTVVDANNVTLNLIINNSAAQTVRTIALVGSAGTSNTLSFAVLPRSGAGGGGGLTGVGMTQGLLITAN